MKYTVQWHRVNDDYLQLLTSPAIQARLFLNKTTSSPSNTLCFQYPELPTSQ